MSKTLYLPEHVAQKRKAEKEAASASSIADSAYIPADERVLDPSLLEQPLVERLPQPTGWRILVMPYQGKAKTGGWHTRIRINLDLTQSRGASKVNGFALVAMLDLVLKLMVAKFAS